ncbi:phospholipase A [Variovorax sp. PvP013]|uniref:phospholipase A n=1 Tax=Variovorax sp. PvP013 TaxID=3156435 RepID=UPI003D25AA81
MPSLPFAGPSNPRLRRTRAAGSMLAGLGLAMAAQAQTQPPADRAAPAPIASPGLTWQQCQRLDDSKEARLACFDRWAQEQQQLPATASTAPSPSQPLAATGVRPAAPTPATATAPVAPGNAALASAQPVADAAVPVKPVIVVAATEGCRDRQYSAFSRFWELEEGSDCGTFGFRGYRPLSVSATAATNRPDTPTSPAAGHTGTPTAYQANEMRIGLSVRTKLAQGLLTGDDPQRKDSLWFAYTQQSSWQLFNGALSRPFRATDHEPEMMYVYPTNLTLPGGWRWRYLGAGIAHQSNGQALPLSRSWNRTYLMTGVELDSRFQIAARFWNRIAEDPAKDDNPDIADYIGRAEFIGRWNFDRDNTFGLTLRNNLRSSGHGSLRLEWLKALGDPVTSNLRLHTQLFHGYGDTLVDYNRKRTVLSIGLSLVDF